MIKRWMIRRISDVRLLQEQNYALASMGGERTLKYAANDLAISIIMLQITIAHQLIKPFVGNK